MDESEVLIGGSACSSLKQSTLARTAGHARASACLVAGGRGARGAPASSGLSLSCWPRAPLPLRPRVNGVSRDRLTTLPMARAAARPENSAPREIHCSLGIHSRIEIKFILYIAREGVPPRLHAVYGRQERYAPPRDAGGDTRHLSPHGRGGVPTAERPAPPRSPPVRRWGLEGVSSEDEHARRHWLRRCLLPRFRGSRSRPPSHGGWRRKTSSTPMRTRCR